MTPTDRSGPARMSFAGRPGVSAATTGPVTATQQNPLVDLRLLAQPMPIYLAVRSQEEGN